MKMNILNPKQALNKAFLKVKPSRAEIEAFKANLIRLLDRTNDTESEEFHKNLISDFLKKTYYDPKYFINTKGRSDLVIHNADQANSSVGVIIEAKKPGNKTEMPTPDKLNAKALHELLLYYLRERIARKNLEIKHLVITNVYEWFIFDAATFERLVAQNKNLVKQFRDFEAGRLPDTRTSFFYKEIAEPFIKEIEAELECAYFNLKDYEAVLRNGDQTGDHRLIALYKLLSPEHLLKLPFANDSNTLDRHFYNELLHIMGLTEVKEGNKRLIQRNQAGERHSGTLIEDTIIQLESLDKISRLDNPAQYGKTHEERLFNVALELCITWINRILFLKLLEAQLIAYHKGDKSYAFLNAAKIKNYDDLNSLFFQVLARPHHARNEDVRKDFEKVPYLNSSLFEPSELEQKTIFISNLKDDKTIPLHAQTVLKDARGKRRTGKHITLHYLFDFLDAYDFSGEGAEDIQEENKTLINASVLGLIFEKINGYKDGSFFTPGFVTMYMCRETIRRAVVQKFNEVKGWNCQTLEEVYDKIEDRHEANAIVNSLKICDPAVGSGHFLVSALNEMIAIKNDLKILQDREGRRLKEYRVEVVNDELVITGEEGDLFEYNPRNPESQRVQEALFHEKQTIIENCLFGVDLNPNSVKICRLRLWIELLKHAYYKNETELETLPNIDINIKCGNSLVSRFAIDADLKQALKKSKWSIDTYRSAVNTYRNAQNKEEKRQMERLIADIKADFRSEISKNDPKMKKLRRLQGELQQLTTQQQLFEMNKKEKAAWNKKVQQLTNDIQKLEAEIEAIQNNKFFENAFEWRFEFPEVLDDEGNFAGFDVVIGNPPYIQLQSMKETSEQLEKLGYETYEKTGDIYALFYERGIQILKPGGYLAYITSNKWMRAAYGQSLRNYFLNHTQVELLIDLGSGIFDEATVDANILIASKRPGGRPFDALDLSKEKNVRDIGKHTRHMVKISPQAGEGWIIATETEQRIKAKIEAKGVPLKDWDVQIYRGVLTGYNKAFVITTQKRHEILVNCQSEDERRRTEALIKPLLKGRDIKRYRAEWKGLWLIATFPALNLDIEDYPSLKAYLEQFLPKIKQTGEEYIDENGKKQKTRKKTANKWFETQDSIAYYQEFEKEKIGYKDIADRLTFCKVEPGVFFDNTVYFLNLCSNYVLALLNSKSIDWYYRKLSVQLGNESVRMFSIYVENIPMPRLSEAEQQPFVEIVNEILAKKERGEDTGALERQIDLMVYKLYDLTYEEVQAIDPDCPFTQEEYEGFVMS